MRLRMLSLEKIPDYHNIVVYTPPDLLKGIPIRLTETVTRRRRTSDPFPE